MSPEIFALVGVTLMGGGVLFILLYWIIRLARDFISDLRSGDWVNSALSGAVSAIGFGMVIFLAALAWALVK